MESKPDTIKVSALHREEIYANHADLFVTVKGSSVVSGDQALKKAKEVNQLVEALTRPALSGGEGFGLSPEAIHLQGVHIETSSGVLLKSSSATYRLKVQCEKLEQLADILDILASQKNAALERIQWKYPEEAARERGMDAVLQKAKSKAEKVARSLGVKLLGVYDFIENIYDEEMPYQQFAAQAMQMKSRGAAAPEPSLGMDIQHNKTINVNVDIWYRVSAF
ncbi:MAG TPA: SIMPL domain-containing protein [Anaerolineales bacterium]|nr:SIMPL domain-containing protein [Anaerolineales bacterium]